MHQDMAVYFLSHLFGHRVEYSKEDTWLLTSLANLDILNQDGNFAKEILELLSGHSRFSKVRRVCIAQRLGVSNQLRTLCSATSSDIDDLMSAGYSCFVNPNGSIFKLSSQNMRAFLSVEKVMESFQLKGMPLQRSLSLINSMGLKSGMCWGQFNSLHLMGMLFINSAETDAPEVTDPDYSIYAFLSHMVLAHLLARVGYSLAYTQLVENREADCIGKAFDGRLLQDLLSHDFLRIAGVRVAVHMDAEIPHTLVSHGHVSQIIARLLASLSTLPRNLTIVARIIDGSLRFTAVHNGEKTLNAHDYRVSLAKVDAESIGLRVGSIDGCITIETPYDGTALCDYSTVA